MKSVVLLPLSGAFFFFALKLATATPVADCISEFSNNEEALEGCLSQFYQPDTMNANELLAVHRAILSQLKNSDYEQVHQCARISAKLCIVHLEGDWYSADVAARLVAKIGEEVGGDLASIIADATVSAAIESSQTLGTLHLPATTSATSRNPARRLGTATAATPASVPIFFDNEVVVSAPTDGNPTP